jgi:hypothetical protein
MSLCTWYNISVADPDPCRSEKPDPHRCEKTSGSSEWLKRRIRTGVKVEIRDLRRSKAEPWRTANAHNGGLEAQNVALEGLHCMSVVVDSSHFDEEQDTDPQNSASASK